MLRCSGILALFALSFSAQAQHAVPEHQVIADFLLEYMEVRYPGTDLKGDIVYVSVRSQRLFHVRAGQLLHEYTISTALAGLGETRDSYRTPTGLHYVRERLGGGIPPWGILRERRYTGVTADSTATPNGDVITSRILRLAGMESGVNAGGAVDSFDRNIYIHGTADEGSLGAPSSHGCIRMRNRDVIALFNEVPVGALVVIYDN